jgi:hypothetical protein
MHTEFLDIETLLNGANGGRWTDQRLEQQDDGQFLLVSVEIEPDLDLSSIEQIRADIRAILKAKVATRPIEYSWMAVLKKRGAVVESLMGGSSDGLPEV